MKLKKIFRLQFFSSWTVKLLFVVFGRLSYSFFTDVKSNLSVPPVYIIEYWIAKIWPLYEGSISKWPRPNWRQRVWIFRNAYQFVLGQVIKQTKAWKAMKLLISAIKSILSIVLMKISTRYYRSFRITGWDWFTGLTDRPVLSRECRMIIRRLWQSWLSRGQTWNCPFTPRLNPDK